VIRSVGLRLFPQEISVKAAAMVQKNGERNDQRRVAIGVNGRELLAGVTVDYRQPAARRLGHRRDESMLRVIAIEAEQVLLDLGKPLALLPRSQPAIKEKLNALLEELLILCSEERLHASSDALGVREFGAAQRLRCDQGFSSGSPRSQTLRTAEQ
jgi:hypothetical protein